MLELYTPQYEKINTKERITIDLIRDGQEFMQQFDIFCKRYSFSTREKECLYWLVKGKTAKETGNILCLSSKTVETYIRMIKCKMRYELCAWRYRQA